ncbi:YopX family protein [Lentilactobacillus parabuchneri]|uniref:YopX family protein n=1 Tax=Lentilactobacillus parabuchneri TaxID=152331 RepID=UPI002307C5C0|nr:YopX family protein [Lentilactobacillus parabuchneri]MDB1104702.1 YopX family protein [Lentilactobacillus parabuchneri]
MTRQIKFRAWHMPFGSKGPMQQMFRSQASSVLSFAEMNPDAYIVEQFTGLKDKNGKDIYERDILATSSKIGGKLITDYLKVDWREDYAGFFCGEKPLYACLGEWDNDIKYPQTFPEIVGNVHTKPELLEAQHDTRTD